VIVTSLPSGATPIPPPLPPPARPPAITPLGLAALVVSGVCTAWLGVEILLRTEGAADGLVSASFVIAIVLAVVVVVLAVLAWRQDRRRGGLWGVIAVTMAASDRIFLALFTFMEGLG
jgi:cytochrome bd-type quinol oxidase subunit 2